MLNSLIIVSIAVCLLGAVTVCVVIGTETSPFLIAGAWIKVDDNFSKLVLGNVVTKNLIFKKHKNK